MSGHHGHRTGAGTVENTNVIYLRRSDSDWRKKTQSTRKVWKNELMIYLAMWDCLWQNMMSYKPRARRGYFVLRSESFVKKAMHKVSIDLTCEWILREEGARGGRKPEPREGDQNGRSMSTDSEVSPLAWRDPWRMQSQTTVIVRISGDKSMKANGVS